MTAADTKREVVRHAFAADDLIRVFFDARSEVFHREPRLPAEQEAVEAMSLGLLAVAAHAVSKCSDAQP